METLSTKKIDKMRWLTLILQIFVGTTSAFLNCLSVYIGPFAEKGWDPAIIVITYSIMMFMGLPGSILGGKLKEKYGNKLVLKVGGIGFALSVVIASFSVGPWMYVICMGFFAPLFVYSIYVVQIANIGELFPDRRGFATGLAIGGIALASAFAVPLAEWVTRVMELTRGIAMFGIVIGGLTFVIGFLIVEAPQNYKPNGWEPKEYEILDKSAADASKSQEINWRGLLRRPAFYLLFFGTVAVAIFLSGLQSNFIMVTEKVLGTEASSGAWLYTLFSVAMGGSGFIIGWISDKILGPVKIIALVFSVVSAFVLVFIITGGTDFALYVAVLIALGFGSGCIQCLTPPILIGAWGSKYFGITYGIILSSLTVSSFIGPQFAVKDPIMNFFIIGTIGMIVGAMMILLAGKLINKELGQKRF